MNEKIQLTYFKIPKKKLINIKIYKNSKKLYIIKIKCQ